MVTLFDSSVSVPGSFSLQIAQLAWYGSMPDTGSCAHIQHGLSCSAAVYAGVQIWTLVRNLTTLCDPASTPVPRQTDLDIAMDDPSQSVGDARSVFCYPCRVTVML